MAILEICVESAAGLEAARAGGADRAELCNALELGGLTPSPGLIALAARQPLPCHAMIRPRAGGFAYSVAEVAQMESDIAAIAAAGLAGVVFGATRDGALDRELLARLLAHTAAVGEAAGRRLSTTLHRAIDTLADPVAATDVAAALGFDRVLTSGGAPTAIAGRETLRAMREHAGDAIGVMAGSGIDADNVGGLLALGLGEIHASCSVGIPEDDRALAHLGFSHPRSATDVERVRALRRALDHR
jgi:copper homeostasis protein